MASGGNPYPSPINADSITSILEFASTIAFYQATSRYAGIYGYYNISLGYAYGSFRPSKYIPSMQSFMVGNDCGLITPPAVAPVITISNSMRAVVPEALNTNYYKKNAASDNVKLPFLKLSANIAGNNDMQDETVVFFDSKASYAYNAKYDARKIFNSDEDVPNIYSVINDKHLAGKGFPEIKDNMMIPLGMGIQKAGKYTISASEIKNMPEGTEVYIEDIKTAKTQNLSLNPVYTFNIDASDDNRFFIRFALKTTGTNNIAENELCNIYSNSKDLYVIYNNPANETAVLSIMNMEGQLIKADVKISNGSYHTALDVAPGVYFVKVTSADKVYTQKVFIK